VPLTSSFDIPISDAKVASSASCTACLILTAFHKSENGGNEVMVAFRMQSPIMASSNGRTFVTHGWAIHTGPHDHCGDLSSTAEVLDMYRSHGGYAALGAVRFSLSFMITIISYVGWPLAGHFSGGVSLNPKWCLRWAAICLHWALLGVCCTWVRGGYPVICVPCSSHLTITPLATISSSRCYATSQLHHAAIDDSR
jgi:hypothetical protein